MAVVWIQFVNIAFHVCLFFFFFLFFHPFRLRTSELIWVWYKIWFLLPVWTNCKVWFNGSFCFHNSFTVWCIWQCSGPYNRMQSSPFNESSLSLSTVAFSASSFCFTSYDGKLIQGPVPSFKGPQLNSVDEKVHLQDERSGLRASPWGSCDSLLTKHYRWFNKLSDCCWPVECFHQVLSCSLSVFGFLVGESGRKVE